MTTIRTASEIANYFVETDWRDATGNADAFSERLTRHYESGDVILVRNPPIEVDYHLVNRITLQQGRAYQKTTDRFFMYPNLLNFGALKTLHAAMKGDIRLYLAFRSEVARVSAQLRAFGRLAFKKYRFRNMGLSWRFTETKDEDLHLDGYGIDEDLQYVRIFLNVDEQPRLWHVSFRLDELIPKFYASAGMASAQGAPADILNKRFNLHVFGGKERMGRDGFPRHEVEFSQGDLWLCDSRLVSHQIVRGRRLIATHFQADAGSMGNPDLSLENRWRRYHGMHADALPAHQTA
jgi:hypothetical protein